MLHVDTGLPHGDAASSMRGHRTGSRLSAAVIITIMTTFAVLLPPTPATAQVDARPTCPSAADAIAAALLAAKACGGRVRIESQTTEDGGIRGKSIIQVRDILLTNGFTQQLSNNKSGYLFKNAAGEEVRIMQRNGAWDVRVKNQYGNYLDEYGKVAAPANTHGIGVTCK